MMSEAFYYLHITITAQSAYPKSHYKFSRYFSFKVIYRYCFTQNRFLFRAKIYADLFLSASCVIK